MSEIDRLSNSGLYPALPIADRPRGRNDSAGGQRPDPRARKIAPKESDRPATDPSQPPSSHIDEYA